MPTRPSMLVVIAITLCVLADRPAAAESLVTGSFVGQVASRGFVAIVAGEDGVRGYFCDGQHVGTWFAAAGRSGNTLEITAEGGATLAADLSVRRAVGRVSHQGRSLPFAAVPARGTAGLYRWQGAIGGVPLLIGWVVLNDGKQVGVLTSDGGSEPAPYLLSYTLPTATLGSYTIVPALTTTTTVTTNGQTNSVMAFDLKGNGVDLGGQAQTTLLGTAQTVRWTRSGTDDAFLAVDVRAARTRYDVFDVDGRLLDGVQVVRGGLTILDRLTGVRTTATTGWHVLAAFDAKRDGVLDGNDPVWPFLLLFRDGGTSGRIDAGELFATKESVAGVLLSGFVRTTDVHGNVLESGLYIPVAGATKLPAVGATLRRLS